MKLRPIPAAVLRRLFKFGRSERGNIAVTFGLLLIPLAGTLALGTEVSSWLVLHRAEQNAADSAAIAAAAEGGDGTGEYTVAGADVASQYGFTNGGTSPLTTTVTISTATSDEAIGSCSSTTPCYQATITRNVPISLSSVLGYKGTSGKGYQTVSASAVAVTQAIQGPFCIVALAGITGTSSLTCNVFSVAGMTCPATGSPVTHGVADSEGAITGQCGVANQFSSQPVPADLDPYSGDESSIASAISGGTNECQGSTHTYYPVGNANFPSGNVLTSDPTWDGGTAVFCGDVEINGTVNFSSSNPTTIIIENGALDLASGTLSSGSGGLTIIFTGAGGNGASNTYTSGGTPADFIEGNGNLNISAPSSGNFSGVAIFQDTNFACCQTASLGGSSPSNFAISGGIQAASLILSLNGYAGQALQGLSCFTLIVNTLEISSAFDLDFQQGAQAQCPQSQQVDALTGYTGQLVQ
jgi:Flp pilus assembly protein TadG